MAHHIPDHISYGAIGSDLVVLDLRADRYLLLRGEDAAALAEIGRDSEAVVPASALARLSDRKLVQSGEGKVHAAVTGLEPRTSAIEIPGEEARVSSTEAIVARSEAAIWLRLSGLHGCVRKWRVRGTACRGGTTTSLFSGTDLGAAALAIARGYATARLSVPMKRLCVPDSLALMTCLWRRGIDADLFFGVRLAPFAAHAWVQCGDQLLADPVGLVADYHKVFRL